MKETTKKLAEDCDYFDQLKEEKMEKIYMTRKKGQTQNMKITTFEEMLKWKQREREKKEKELVALEMKLKEILQEIEKYKQETEETAEKLRQADFVHQLQIAQQEKKAPGLEGSKAQAPRISFDGSGWKEGSGEMGPGVSDGVEMQEQRREAAH